MTIIPFAVIPVGHPMLTSPSQTLTETCFLYGIPNCPSTVIALTPGVSLPPNTACAIFAAKATDTAAAITANQDPPLEFLGGIGPGQESVLVSVEKYSSDQGIAIAITIEPEEQVAEKLKTLPSSVTDSLSLGQVSHAQKISLAQAVIENAFDFMASFSGTTGPGGVEVVPLKAFQNWWKKFEGRVRSDPTFLENRN